MVTPSDSRVLKQTAIIGVCCVCIVAMIMIGWIEIARINANTTTTTIISNEHIVK